MPAASRRQQRYLYAKFGSAWVHAHHFDQLVPALISKRPRKRRRKR